MCEEPPTETDRLLPTPVSERKSFIKKDASQIRRRRCIVGGVAVLALVFSIFAVLSSHPINRRPLRSRDKDKSFHAKQQLDVLQRLTEKALVVGALSAATADVTPSHHKSHHPKGKIEVLDDKKHKHDGINDGVYHCTSRVVIMRHCEKEVKVHHNGKIVKQDTRDVFGDRHCSARGEKRSEYIATLFVNPDAYQHLVDEDNNNASGEVDEDDGIIPLPVPMIKSSMSEVGSSTYKRKPQFPSPHHLYALSASRSKNRDQSKGHDNYREIETITPLSRKFHLDVDERFGIGEEGDLALDFFENLSESVMENVNIAKMKMGSTTSSSAGGTDGVGGESAASSETMHLQLCNNGMTVVNWKHSRIPMLARALGCGKDQGCPRRYQGDDFDTMWLLTFQYSILLGEDDNLNVDSSILALESLSESAHRSLRHHKKKRRSGGSGNWKITAELVNEGFDTNA
eukprot:CAMPEP_0181075686 /NCGR_PEP_ID=MMETSP1071-20121207/18_1 /TAXON_ID=35127 /ORGANISM="Thalassiosira sp., Strain NH16" /LENGTH=456 /DNA_ID=CAMNT_0023156817 /DNA_START=94 /DNA_END=1464 /DNA_ORIENTATION=-